MMFDVALLILVGGGFIFLAGAIASVGKALHLLRREIDDHVIDLHMTLEKIADRQNPHLYNTIVVTSDEDDNFEERPAL